MPVWAFFNSLDGSDENRRFDTIVDENKHRAVRVLRAEGAHQTLKFIDTQNICISIKTSDYLNKGESNVKKIAER